MNIKLAGKLAVGAVVFGIATAELVNLRANSLYL